MRFMFIPNPSVEREAGVGEWEVGVGEWLLQPVANERLL